MTPAQSLLEEIQPLPSNNSVANKVTLEDRAFHEWYRFVLSFPPHLVSDYIAKFDLGPQSIILDPFCGTGTTVVEAKLHGISNIGIEANPVAYLASSVKTNWNIDPDRLYESAQEIAAQALSARGYRGQKRLRSLPPDSFDLLLKNSISPLPLHKALILSAKIN
ncbi:MAG: DNA methyltransferase, partial [Thermosynechococcaceae cyanobacterium]